MFFLLQSVCVKFHAHNLCSLGIIYEKPSWKSGATIYKTINNNIEIFLSKSLKIRILCALLQLFKVLFIIIHAEYYACLIIHIYQETKIVNPVAKEEKNCSIT